MKEQDILKSILNRLARLDGTSNIFTADEVAGWPDGALESLQVQGLLKKTESAQTVECRGCEQDCMMLVNLAHNEARGLTKAFIACDKRDDVGRVPVGLADLSQWKITGHSVALKLSEMLNMEQDPKEKQRAKLWVLGALKGKVNRPRLALSLDDGVKLKVGSREVALLDVLTFKKGNLSLNADELIRMADQPPKKPTQYKPSVIKREARKLETEQLHKSWQREYRNLKSKHPNMSDVRCSQLIAKCFENRHTPETIRKNMKS